MSRADALLDRSQSGVPRPRTQADRGAYRSGSAGRFGPRRAHRRRARDVAAAGDRHARRGVFPERLRARAADPRARFRTRRRAWRSGRAVGAATRRDVLARARPPRGRALERALAAPAAAPLAPDRARVRRRTRQRPAQDRRARRPLSGRRRLSRSAPRGPRRIRRSARTDRAGRRNARRAHRRGVARGSGRAQARRALGRGRGRRGGCRRPRRRTRRAEALRRRQRPPARRSARALGFRAAVGARVGAAQGGALRARRRGAALAPGAAARRI